MKNQNASWEAVLREQAAAFPYPPTPDIAAGVRQRLAAPAPGAPRRRLAYGAVLVLLLLAALLAAPPVRATLVSLFRAGAITIFVGAPTPTPTPIPAQAAATAVPVTPLTARMATIAEPVTLAQAQSRAPAPLQLPAAWELPHEIWLHEQEWATAVISLWYEDDEPPTVAYSLYQIDAGQYAYKGAERLQDTTVNGDLAFWIDGPHYFQLQDGSVRPWLIVEGNVLIWWTEGQTFRLEGAATLAEAIRIAESVAPVADEE